MTKRIISLTLVLCLLQTACGGKEKDSRGQASLLSRAAELEEERVLLVVDGREGPAWRYLYWLAYTCDRIQKQYDQAHLPLDWNAAVTGGTLADYARDQALADTALYATVENWAEKYDIVVDGEEQSTASMPEEGLTPEQMVQLEQVGELYASLYALYCAEDSALAPAEETLRIFAQEQGWLTLDRILIPYGEDPEAARQAAAEAFSRLNGAADQGAEFTALAAAGADTAGPRTITIGNGTLDPALEEAAEPAEEQPAGNDNEGFFD